MRYTSLSAFLLLALAACQPVAEEPITLDARAPEAAAADSTAYEAQGVIVAFLAEKKYVNIRHGAIPGYMGAMTMPFPVLDSTLLRGLHPGDSVVFRFTPAAGIEAMEKIVAESR